MIKKLLFIKEYRKRIIEISSFIICCTFSIFNLTLFFMSKSIWYFMLAVYYVSLSFARGIIYFENRMRSKNKIKELSIYRKSAIFLLIMNFALGISTILTVSFQGSFKYSGIFIYGVAIYAFFKIQKDLAIVKSLSLFYYFVTFGLYRISLTAYTVTNASWSCFNM